MKNFMKVGTFLALLVVASGAWADDAEKLKELERAMMASPVSEEMPQPKRRTRAIVPDVEYAADQQQVQSASQPMVANTARDCRTLPPDVKGVVAVDFSIQFQVGSAKISPTSTKVLNEIAKILALSPNRCVLVEGHTDISGDADRNMTLSHERANSVVDYVAEVKGLDRKNLVAVGKGSTDPLKDLSPRDPRNRRVVFKVVNN